ncbi:MAG: hypothetical protein LBR11_04570 [Deltaproteobacteria bacterium]|jgi:uncharacterized protein YecT (DUF1311 family)|nr:hypothetical protein [Deltaproteobacteria bacterium]
MNFFKLSLLILLLSFVVCFLTDSLWADNVSKTPKPSFDCAAASTDVEKIVCSDVELADLDMEMSQLYFKIRNQLTNKEPFTKEQITFIKYLAKKAKEYRKYDHDESSFRKSFIYFLKNFGYKYRIRYFKFILAGQPLPRSWVNVDQGDPDPCRGNYANCDPRGIKGIYKNGRVVWSRDTIWLKLDEGDPDTCHGILDYEYCPQNFQIVDESSIILKPPRPESFYQE